MEELLEKQMGILKTPLKETENRKNVSINSQTNKNGYNLKEQLDQLIGPSDFNYKLEKVNLTIGIIVSSMLLLFFFL
jgi:preprotein translocase subunit SecF